MAYLSYLSNTLTTKNNLEKAIVLFLKEQERKLIPEQDLKAFKNDILQGIVLLNEKHNRCKPVKAEWYTSSWSHNDRRDVHLHLGGFISFHLHASKEPYSKEENKKSLNALKTFNASLKKSLL